MKIHLILLMVIILSSCNKNMNIFEGLTPYHLSKRKFNINDTTSLYVDTNHPAVMNMRKRAYQIATIKWSPLNNIPNNNGEFLSGETIYGIPYSSVKELDKFVGHEVSFHTFIAALNNPNSVLYSENVSQYPYLGTNCASYYGTVCSMAVNYALGIDRPYTANMYGTLPIFQRVAKQNFMYCAPGDVVWCDGHVVLITALDRDDEGEIQKIEILESAPPRTAIKYYSYKEFCYRWEKINWILYRYKHLNTLNDYTPLPYVQVFDEPYMPVKVNNDLALDRGDRVSYRKGEVINVDLLTNKYKDLIIQNINTNHIDTLSISEQTRIQLYDLNCGEYYAFLYEDNGISDTIEFEIIDINVNVTTIGPHILVSFTDNNYRPEYIVVCDKSGGRYHIIDINEEDRIAGKKYLHSEHSLKDLYIKVFFKVKYGYISNTMIPIN